MDDNASVKTRVIPKYDKMYNKYRYVLLILIFNTSFPSIPIRGYI